MYNQYWVELKNSLGKWKYFTYVPPLKIIYESTRVLARDINGIFFWYKNRETGLRSLNETELKEVTFIILNAID